MKKILCLMVLFLVSNAHAKTKAEPKVQVATFAAGCFWCVQPAFDKIPGVLETHVGFSGGDKKNVTYKDVSTGSTGHAESIEITFDAEKVAYQKLLDAYWENIDPTDSGGQFVDRGSQYRPVIFYHDDDQKKIAEESKKRLENSKRFSKPIAVAIEPYKFFVHVEGGDADIHEKYYQKNPFGYELYKKGSGREKILKEMNNKK